MIQMGFLAIHHLQKLAIFIQNPEILEKLKISPEQATLKYVLKYIILPIKKYSMPMEQSVARSASTLQIAESSPIKSQVIQRSENLELSKRETDKNTVITQPSTPGAKPRKYDILIDTLKDYNASKIGNPPSRLISFPLYFIFRYEESTFSYMFLKDFLKRQYFFLRSLNLNFPLRPKEQLSWTNYFRLYYIQINIIQHAIYGFLFAYLYESPIPILSILVSLSAVEIVLIIVCKTYQRNTNKPQDQEFIKNMQKKCCFSRAILRVLYFIFRHLEGIFVIFITEIVFFIMELALLILSLFPSERGTNL